MPAVDPFVPLRDWRSSLYRADPAVINRFLDGIDATLPAGWIRDRDYERTRLQPECIRGYLFDGTGDAAVRVWLQRVTATRVRGGPVELLRHVPSGATERIGRLVAEFADGCVLPPPKRPAPSVRAPRSARAAPLLLPLKCYSHDSRTRPTGNGH
jgi:hypothetical protein